ncbi:putative cyclin-B3-1 [Tripterygium wilfordii]|uniref:B-like cyclin n=1 Tax=Tripterygium wilfordii TaxID=458696 RepID=A0A7J7C1Z9_TRIWF|nr:putative cyclin-B3-1 [Tripterygium wilfordii]KAF5728174.1 putative cyclin-B3-1 [Tripterygium wilfordii]
MTSLKGKLYMGANQATEDSKTAHTVRGGIRKLKVFSENEKGKADASRMRNSLSLRKEPDLTNANGLKGSSTNMGKCKGKCDSAANAKATRKALADVSNLSANSSRIVVCSKPVVSVGPGLKAETISSRIPSAGKGKQNSSGDLYPTKQGSKDPMESSDDKSTKSKNQSRESVATYGRNVANKSLIPTRKSFPVLKRVNQSSTSNTKIKAEGSEKGKHISGVQVKSKFNRKVAPQVSNARSNLWMNRKSDGFIIMGTRAQSNVDSQASSRKSVRPIVKTSTLKVSDAQRKLKSKCAPGKIKVLSVNLSSQKEEEVITSSIPAPGVPYDVIQGGEPLSDGKNDQSTKKAEIVAKRGRRRSYTSLLMAGPKLLEESGEIMKRELPSIDDSCNQLEVVQYIDEIYQYYWVTEAHNSSLENYMSIQTDITPPMRGILVNWLVEVHLKFDLMAETLYLMVTILDQYLSQVKIRKSELQLVGLAALLLASKYEDFWHPRIKDLLSISVEAYTRDQMLGMEKLILKHLKFRLNSPTPYVFMLRFLKAAQSDTKLEHLAFYLIDLCLVEYEALKFKPSLLCASAIYVARCTLQINPAWTPLLIKHARYEMSQIRTCAEMILKFQKAARTGKLNVTYEKYLRPELSNAATIKPLNRLPL